MEMNWIDINTQKPEKNTGKPVLFFTKSAGVKVGGLRHWSSDGSWEDWTEYDRDGSCEAYYEFDVTHWMPLPKPPSERAHE